MSMKGKRMSETDQQQPAMSKAAAEEKLQLMQSRFGAAAADYVTSKVHASGRDLAWLVEDAALTGRERVLDVATGGGHAAFALAPHAAEVVALDLTQPMLEVAHQEAIARHLNNIHYLEGDAQALPCEDSSFDTVVCRKAAHHFPYVQRAIAEWMRVLKPGGMLIMIDSASPEEPEIDAFLHEIETLRDPSHVRNYRVSEWRAMLSEAGFDLRNEREWGLFLDIPSWTQRMRTSPEAVARIEQMLNDAPPQTRERLLIEVRDGDLGFTLPCVELVGIK